MNQRAQELHLGGYASARRGVSSAGRAPALQAGGRRFDPGTLHLGYAGVMRLSEILASRTTPRLPHSSVARDPVKRLDCALRSARIQVPVPL
jgi:hypothetical protein